MCPSESNKSWNPAAGGGAALHAWFLLEPGCRLAVFLARIAGSQLAPIPRLELTLCFALNKLFNLKLTCKSEGLGIGEAFLLSVLNLNNSETCGQRFSPAKGRTNMKFSSSKASSEQAWLIPGGE